MMTRYWNRFNLTVKFMLPLGVAVSILMGVGAFYMIQQQKQAMLREVGSLADIVEAQIRTTRGYITENYVQKIKESPAKDQVKVPLPATATIEMAKQLSRDGWFTARLISSDPENDHNKPVDSFEKQGLQTIETGQKSHELIEEVDGQMMYRRITPDVAVTEGCVTGCHEGYKQGDILGGLVISIPIGSRVDAVAANSKLLIGITVTLVAVMLLLLWLVARKLIAGPMGELARATELVAGGDLKQRVEVRSDDEIGRLARGFNGMVERLGDLVGKIKGLSGKLAETGEEMTTASGQVSQAMGQITSAVQEVAAGANRQSGGAGETVTVMSQLRQAIDQIASGTQTQAQSAQNAASVMTQMAQGIDGVARGSEEVSVASVQALTSAREGGEAVSQTVEGMARIREAVLGVAASVKELGERSQQVGEIVQVISGIADQTNLLALNAAIEAARAGEHGKGFAVVAEEVRKLAERSSQATKDIDGIISTIQRGVEAAVEGMTEGTKEVEAGTRLAASAGVALQEILRAMEQTNQQIQGISAASQQVAAGAGEVLKAVDNVAAITEESTAATEQMAASSDQVLQAANMVVGVSRQTAASTQEVSSSVEEVNASVGGISRSAKELAEQALELKGLVQKFSL